MGGFRILLAIIGILIVSSLVHKMNQPMPKKKAKIIKTMSFFKSMAWIALDLSLFSALWNPITIGIDVIAVIVIIFLSILPLIMIKHYLKKLKNIKGGPLNKASEKTLENLNQAAMTGDMDKIQQILHNSMLKNTDNRESYDATLTVLGKCIGESPDDIEGAVQDAFHHNPSNLERINHELDNYNRNHPNNTIGKHIMNYAKEQNKKHQQDHDDDENE